MSTSAFFSDSETVIQRTVEVRDRIGISSDDIKDNYEIERCVCFISSNNFSKVALQFPDELLCDSATVANTLQSESSASIFILGDTSYGSCCVDEVAAQHGAADALIHFGPACLSPTHGFPVLYVFGHRAIDVADCCQKFCGLFPDKSQPILVLCDVMYSHALDEIQLRLQGDYPNLVFSSIKATGIETQHSEHSPASKPSNQTSGCHSECTSGGCCSGESIGQQIIPQQDASKEEHTLHGGVLSRKQTCCHGDEARTPKEISQVENDAARNSKSHFGRHLNLRDNTRLEDYVVFYIGSEGRTLTNFMMTYNKSAFFTYDPETQVGRRETLNVNKALMRRYHMIEKAKDANVVGIVAGTLGVANYLDIISHLKKLLRHAGKKCYTFVMGKLNVAKLANFMEVDIYVLVACPENCLIDSKEFYHPVVTPFEIEMACNEAREWTGEYITDFQKLLPGSRRHVELPASSSSNLERTDVSLITGHIRSMGVREEAGDGMTKETRALVKRSDDLTVASIHKDASEFLAGRSWQGLEQKVGETPVTKAAEGRTGIAASYTHEQAS